MGTTLEFRKFMAIWEAVQAIQEADRFLEDVSAEDIDDDNDYRPEEPDWLKPAPPPPPTTKKDTILDPTTGTKWRAVDRWKQLDAVLKHEVQKGTPPNRVWVTFSDVSKLGQRMRVSSGKSTPVGIFAFPAQYVVDRKASTPFSNRPYMHVFRIKRDHFEVGRKDSYTDEPEYGKIKKKYKLDESDPFSLALQELRSKMDSYLYKLYDQHPKVKDNDSVYRYLNTITRDTLTKVEHDYDYSTEGNTPQEKLAKLDLSHLDAPVDTDVAETKQALAKYMGSLSFYSGETDEYKRRYKDVNPEDLSAELSPEYVEYIKKNPYDFYDKAKEAAEKPRRFTFDELKEIDSGAYDTYSSGYKYIKKLQDAESAKEPIVARYKKVLATQIKKTIKKVMETKSQEDDSQVPHYEKLKMLADKFGLDLKSAIKNGMSAGRDERQFLYRSTQDLARQYNKQHPETTWQSAWNKMFRAIDIPSVADTEDSGYVHSAESTQGVFMDPKDVTHITTIHTASHNAPSDPANRPTASHWQRGEGMHKRNITPYTQRRGPQVDMSYFSGKDAAAKTDYALDQRMKEIMQGLRYYNKIDDRNVGKISQTMVLLQQMLKSKLGLKPQGIVNDPMVQELMRRITQWEGSMPNMPPQLKQQFDNIRQIVGGQRQAPRGRAWSPTDDEMNQYWPKKRCPNCGHANDDMSAKRCPSCDKFYPDTKPQTKDCANCGYENDNLELKKCPSCNSYYDPKDKPPSKTCDYCGRETEDMTQKKCKCGHYYDPNDKPPSKECPNCGQETEDMEEKKCDNCGAYYDPKDKPEDEPDLKKCLKCNKMFDEEMDECPHCGADSNYDPDNYQSCQNCGEEFDIDDSKCPNCGYDPTEQYCDKCGENYPEDSECPHCGAPSGWNKHDYQECPECGHEFWNKEDDTCPKCGWDDPDMSSSDKEEAEEDEDEDEGEETPDEKKDGDNEPDTECLNCGAEYKKTGPACPKCGAQYYGQPKKKKKKESDVISGDLPPPPEGNPIAV